MSNEQLRRLSHDAWESHIMVTEAFTNSKNS